MRKVLGVYLILLLLPVCASFGTTGLVQGFLFDAENGVVLTGGSLGAAQNTNLATVNQNQSSNNPYHFQTALQSEDGLLVQNASAVGMNGSFGVAQDGNALGGQVLATGSNPVLDQLLLANFGQDAARLGGIGAALGIQGFIGIQVQIAISPYGADTNVQYLGVGQVISNAGGP